jgi:hypothetical protein
MHQVAPLDFYKRKGLMSLLESRNDMVGHDRQWRYKFIVNVTWTSHACSMMPSSNVDVIMSRGTRVKFLL